MILHLKRALEKQAGFPLDSVKAYRKFEKILYERGVQVSYSTLNRMFSERVRNVTPRVETLNLLSRYLGYKSYEELEQSSFSKIKRDEHYFSNEFTVKSLLLNNEFKSAIDIYLDLMDEYKEYHPEITQVVGNAIFNRPDFNVKHLEYLLGRERIAPYFLEHFVSEDDLYGHYKWSVQNLEFRSEYNEERELFKMFFLKRKEFLRGKETGLDNVDYKGINFHLQSRYFELKLIENSLKKNPKFKDYVLENTDKVIELVDQQEKEHDKFVLIGRWCRALLYTGSYEYLIGLEKWTRLSLNAFNHFYENLEYKAPIYAFLKLTLQRPLSLDFYRNNRWETSKIESELILSMGLKNDRAVKAYKNVLGIEIPFKKY